MKLILFSLLFFVYPRQCLYHVKHKNASFLNTKTRSSPSSPLLIVIIIIIIIIVIIIIIIIIIIIPKLGIRMIECPSYYNKL